MNRATTNRTLEDIIDVHVADGMPRHEAVLLAVQEDDSVFQEALNWASGKSGDGLLSRQMEYGRLLFRFAEEGGREQLREAYDLLSDPNIFPGMDPNEVEQQIRRDLNAVWHFMRLAKIAEDQPEQVKAWQQGGRDAPLVQCLRAIAECQRQQRGYPVLFGHLDAAFLTDTAVTLAAISEQLGRSTAERDARDKAEIKLQPPAAREVWGGTRACTVDG